MELDKVVSIMRTRHYELNMGAGKLAKRYGTERENIYRAKEIIRAEKGIDVKINKIRKPRILLFDLETTPLKAYVWRMWDQNISLDALISEWFLLSYACKWLGEDTMYSGILSPREIKKENDFRLVNELWEFLDEADIVIAHNGKRFDVPRIKARFLVHGLPPTTYYQQIDTLKVAQAEFSLPSNKLEALARTLGLEGKNTTGLKLWVSCMDGDTEALKYMLDYNEQDVLVLEKVYLKLRPFIKSHPNYNLYNEGTEAVCPSCGHTELVKDGNYYTQTGKYETYRCEECGAISRKRKTLVSKEKQMLLSIPGR